MLKITLLLTGGAIGTLARCGLSGLFTFFSVLFFMSGINLLAQPRVTAYIDLGQTSVSNGLFIKTAGLAHYKFGKNIVETGFQLDFKSNNKNTFSGYNIKASRELRIKDFPFEVQGFYIWTPFSDILRETNWGVVLNMKRDHFVMRIGTNFRTFAFTQKAINHYDIETSSKIHENWNLIYSFGYYIKSLDNNWNIGLSVTNIDYFIINQETNPVFYLRALYTLNSPISLFAESWYKSAGAFNLSVNYFGFFFRTGILWDIN